MGSFRADLRPETPPSGPLVASLGGRSADGAAEGRMQQMFQDVRRLQYSYDFASTCVSSLMACVSDADCADDEECSFPRRTRKTRRLSEEEDANANAGRALKFGTNAVGQCVCK